MNEFFDTKELQKSLKIFFHPRNKKTKNDFLIPTFSDQLFLFGSEKGWKFSFRGSFQRNRRIGRDFERAAISCSWTDANVGTIRLERISDGEEADEL